MKILVFLVAVAVLLWLLKGGASRRPRAGPPATPPDAGAPLPIVACAQCGVHLPRDEALPGKGGVFCGDAHRTAYEKEHAARP